MTTQPTTNDSNNTMHTIDNNPNNTGMDFMTVSDMLNLHDPDASGITINAGWITLNWSYPYEIKLSRIRDRGDLLKWTLHLAEKTWMTSTCLHHFISAVMDVKGWDKHQVE